MDFSDFIPGLSIDCVIFGFHDGELRVLLLKMKHVDQWALPGGFIHKEQDVDTGAIVVLQRRTGLSKIFLRQFHLFGRCDRADNSDLENPLNNGWEDAAVVKWFAQRFITVGYYALVEYSKVVAPTPDDLSEKIAWCPLQELPSLILDHNEILDKALLSLRQELQLRPIGINLLPDEFTMPELQGIYEAILGKKLDRRNFRRKMLGFDLLIDTGKKRMGKAHKAPILYRFDEAKYQLATQFGLKSTWG